MTRRIGNNVGYRMKKRWPSLVLGLVVSVIALAYLFRRDFSGVRDELLHARYWMIIPCFAISVVGLWLRAIRWRVLLDGRISLKDSFHIMNVGYFINAVLPLRIGELARAGLARRIWAGWLDSGDPARGIRDRRGGIGPRRGCCCRRDRTDGLRGASVVGSP